jgi:4-amino-4-deoxy-L-arabinose transferase-like glycosyltransferase
MSMRGRVALVLAGALAVRLALVALTPGYVPIHDDAAYARVARSLLDHGGYPAHRLPDGTLQPSSYRPPGWPATLTGLWALTGPSVVAARVLLAVLGTAVCGLVVLVARRLVGNRAALVAGVLTAVSPLLLAVGTTLESETVFIALLLAAVAAALRARDGGGARWLVAVGVLAGLAALTRTNGLLLVPLLAWLAARRPAHGLVVTACAAACIAPWTIRNATVTGAFVPVSSEAGNTLAGTYSTAARTRGGMWIEPSHSGAYRWLYRRYGGSAQLDAPLQRAVLRWVARRPLYPPRVLWANGRRLTGLTSPRWAAFSLQSMSLPRRGGTVVWLGTLLVTCLAAAGIATTWRRRRPPAGTRNGSDPLRGEPLRALVAIALAVFVPAALINGELRLAAPLTALLTIPAAAALVALAEARLLRSRRALVGPVAAVAALATAGTATAALTMRGPLRPAARATVSVDATQRGRIVPPSYLGVSVESDSVGAYVRPPERLRALRRLAGTLAHMHGAGIALRIGGDSADQAWWNPRHRRPRPRAVLQDITPRTLRDVAALARALGGPVTLGANLALGDVPNAAALVRAARRALPDGVLRTVEIGNEPDLYTTSRTFHVPGHVHRRLRKRDRYGPAAYGRDAARMMRGLAGAVPSPPAFAVAGFAGTAWWPALPALLRGWHGHARVLTAHLYGFPRCVGDAPSTAWLASRAASRERAATVRPLVALGRRAGLPVRIGELGSAPCGGRPGFSNTVAAAMWTADTLFAFLADGVDEVDVHTWEHARYAPFAPDGRTLRARPPFAGMDAFARAAPAGSRLVPVLITGDRLLRGWATVDRGGTQRILLLARRAVDVTMRTPRRGRVCAVLWTAARKQQSRRAVCPRGGRLSLRLARRSLAVLALPEAPAAPRSSMTRSARGRH